MRPAVIQTVRTALAIFSKVQLLFSFLGINANRWLVGACKKSFPAGFGLRGPDIDYVLWEKANQTYLMSTFTKKGNVFRTRKHAVKLLIRLIGFCLPSHRKRIHLYLQFFRARHYIQSLRKHTFGLLICLHLSSLYMACILHVKKKE